MVLFETFLKAVVFLTSAYFIALGLVDMVAHIVSPITSVL